MLANFIKLELFSQQKQLITATINPMNIITIIRSSIIGLSLASTSVFAEPAENKLSEQSAKEKAPGAFTLLIENDSFGNPDRDSQYTQGGLLAYAPSGTVDGWQQSLANNLPLFSNDAEVTAEYSLGQQIYTPDNTASAYLDPNDRPYAGWLFAGMALTATSADESRGERTLERWEMNLGVIGPGSGAEDVQKEVHSALNGYDPKGWENQLDDELGVVLAYQKKWLYQVSQENSVVEVELAPNLGGALGNVHSYLEAGLTLRLGKGLQNDYGAVAMRPSGPVNTRFKRSRNVSWYVYTGFQARAVAQNIFLDGNTSGDSHSVDKETFVGDWNSGVVLTLDRYRLTVSHTRQSDQFKTQYNDSHFSAISLTVGF